MQPDYHQMLHNVHTLASLTSNLPVVQTPDGEFVPLRALCEIVGLNPASYIGVFCQYLAPDAQRRLLFWDSPAGRRKDWCVERKHLIYWLVNVPLDRVPPDRRDAVLALQQQSAALLGKAYTLMIDEHHETRREMFRLLKICATQEQHLQGFEALGARIFNQAQRQKLAEWLAACRQVVEALGASARKRLGILMESPIVDGLILNENHEVTGETSFPLFPIVGEPDPAVPGMLDQLIDWDERFTRWWDAQVEGKI